MRITITKTIIPRLASKTNVLKLMEQYNFDRYSQKDQILDVPNSDIPLNLAMDIARLTTAQGYAYWVEVPDTELANPVPSDLSYATYFDDQEPPVEQDRLWSDLGSVGANQAATATMRYFQAANNGEFLYDDIEILEEAGFEVFGQSELGVKLNADYQDPLDPEYAVQETIEYIDQNWRFAGYFDFIHAAIRMGELYTAKGATDLDRWNACTTAEKIVVVKWNLVGLNRANDLAPPSWSEARTAKELNRAYQEFEDNLLIALDKRFKDYFQYLNFSLSGAGRTKFDADWNWDNYHEYIYKAYRFYELGGTNALVDWHGTVLGTYIDADFVGTIPATTIINALGNVLIGKKYIV
jgi:hypothetical protein